VSPDTIFNKMRKKKKERGREYNGKKRECEYYGKGSNE